MDAFDDPVLAEWQEAEQQLSMAAEWYERVQQMRQRADYYETALIRHLKHEEGLTWREVAEIVNANLGSRQAAYAKWRRLAPLPGKPKRRAAGSPARGGWPKGRRRNPADADNQ